MTRNLKRLRTIETVFASREGVAARELAQFQAVLDEASAQLGALRAYRDDYRGSVHSAGATDLSRLQNAREFLRRLDEAITQQTTVVKRAEQSCSALRLRYRESRQRTKAVGKVCLQRRDAYRRAGEQREQKESDAHNNLRRKS